jgi:hypothetical protein
LNAQAAQKKRWAHISPFPILPLRTTARRPPRDFINNAARRAIVAARVGTVDNSIMSAQSLYPRHIAKRLRVPRVRAISIRALCSQSCVRKAFSRAQINAAARGLLH